MMGYDRAITMFSPEGRLLQVEYAKKTVKQGSTAIGITCKEGVLLLTDKRVVDKLIVPDAIEKIFQIDDHVMATGAGIMPDARVLIERAQVKAQQHRVTYDSPIDTLTVIKDLSAIMQMTTQSGGLRPFGVSLLVAGIDKAGISLYQTDPVGVYYEYKACVIGEKDSEVEEMLAKEYNYDRSMDETLKFGLSIMKRGLGEEFDAARVDCSIITLKDKTMKRISSQKIAELLKQAR